MDLHAPSFDLSAAPVENAGSLISSAARGGNRAAARAAAEEFESVFLAQMFAPMFETVETDPLFGGGPGEQMYRSLLVEEYGKAIARAGGVGIADAVEREILKLQEVQE